MQENNLSKEQPNIPPCLQALYNALISGKTIKRVLYAKGSSNKEDKSKHFELKDFTMAEYTIGMSQKQREDSHITDKFDYVDTSEGSGFYLDWVLSFELYK